MFVLHEKYQFVYLKPLAINITTWWKTSWIFASHAFTVNPVKYGLTGILCKVSADEWLTVSEKFMAK